ncbi:MAG: hypothetical protein L0Y56_06480 [Nitrospira sp.]|nr:hypothetical protein [Nitrospira sp.]
MSTSMSPAFLQQCFEIHRKSLSLKQIKDARMLILCTECKLHHTLTVQSKAVSGTHPSSQPIVPPFTQCAANHLSAINIHKVDVVQDNVDLRCTQCQRTDAFTITQCETRPVNFSS